MVAWGNEDEYYYGYDDWNYAQGDMNHVGNQMMLLENRTGARRRDEHHGNSHDKFTTTTTTTVTGNCDPLKNTRKPEPIATHNLYYLLTNDEGDGDDSDSDESQQVSNARNRREKKTSNPNKRQRRRIKFTTTTQHDNDTIQACGACFDDNGLESDSATTTPWRRCRCAHNDDDKIRDAATSSAVTKTD